MEMLATVSGTTPFQTSNWLLETLLVLMLAVYGWLGIKSSRQATLTAQPFGLPDILCASILGLWLLWVIWNGSEGPQIITLRLIVANCIFYVSLTLGIFGIMGFQKNSPISIFHLEPSRFPKAAITGLLWLGILYPLIMVTQGVVQKFSGDSNDSQLIVRYFLAHPDLKHRLAVIFMALVVSPIAEEILFRGYFYGVIRRYAGRIPAILGSSLLFAAIHQHLPSAPGLFLLAMTLCLLYERTGSLWATMTMHSAFNASSVVALIFWPDLA